MKRSTSFLNRSAFSFHLVKMAEGVHTNTFFPGGQHLEVERVEVGLPLPKGQGVKAVALSVISPQ